MSYAREDEKMQMSMLQPTAMDKHRRSPNCCLLVCFFVLLARVHALDQDRFYSPMPGRSGLYNNGEGRGRGAREFSRLPASYRSRVARPISLMEEVHLGRTADPQPHQMQRLPTPTYKREAEETEVKITTDRREMEALTKFKAASIGGNLSIFANWDVNDVAPCGWAGVSCSDSGEHVIALDLVGQQLQGSINSALLALGELQFLRRLDLSNNNFTSSIPGASLLNFSSLASLNLSYNQLEGEIPSQIGELSDLRELAFQFNNLLGKLPVSLCNCTLLRVLNLQANLLGGEIPPDIGKLFQLEVLDLSNFVDLDEVVGRLGNSFSGRMPPSLGNCSSLVLLDLKFNFDLEGRIPQELSQLRSLQIISFAECGFEGVIPKWLGNLTELVQILLAGNALQGPIPVELGRLRHLSWLALGQQNLSGNIPSDLANCTSLRRLRLPDTSINGIIPPKFANISVLTDIILEGNYLLAPGPIPPWLGALPELQTVGLGRTNRRGNIPNELGKLSRLQGLFLGLNDLIGSIPSSLYNCTALKYLTVCENSLTGILSSEIGTLSNLIGLEVRDNLLAGPIPASITNLTNLFALEMDFNSFDGRIDFEWGMVPLRWLNAGGNHFVGSIPKTLANCSNLIKMWIDDNNLTGEIPDSLGNLTQLVDLHVGRNLLSGRIPVDLAGCDHLSSLDFGSNRLDGPFPPELGQLPSLMRLNLSHNQLPGAIPSSMRNLTQILWLDLSYNQLNGTLSQESLPYLQHVVSINVSHNFLSGSLSAYWKNLADIQEIDISSNRVSGTIPDLGTLRALQRLDLSLNSFSGIIPESLASLPELIFFNASFNNLDGPVPAFNTSGANITTASFLGNAGLCGVLLGPGHECRDNVSSSRASCSFFQCPHTRIALLAAGVGCFVLVCLVVVWATRRMLRQIGKREKKSFELQVNFRPFVLEFSPNDILAIIRNEGNAIGTTGESAVYKGSIRGCDNVIAIKTFVGPERDGVGRWHNLLEREAMLHASIRHRNVLKLLSFCSHRSFKALLLEYMPQGSLHDHLYPGSALNGRRQESKGGEGDSGEGEFGGEFQGGGRIVEQNCQLPWSVRLDIAIDVAEGLTYLHDECPKPLIHGDMKPSNILLDEEMVAKVSDFGISRLVNPGRARGGSGEGEASISCLCGTVGYMPPEYAFVAALSTKGDVFSYGMVLLEMLSGFSPTSTNDSGESDYRGRNLQCFQNDLLELLDPILQREGRTDVLKLKQMTLVAKAAFLCTRESPQRRPLMREMRSMLLTIKGLGAEVSPKRLTVDELAHLNNEY